ncbi:hypothetical protein FPZ45_17150 [Cohnella terricola]|uniref:Uncharacterized protein n=1 Tax=Cohnella terricola TaxID=1289167 RepID=A0A559JDU7_9BACL|nr:hypothetical protein FPZ45_17150 [Cohnella terricola]
MLGDIDDRLKPIQPKYFIAKPNGEIVSKISEAYDDRRVASLTSLNTLSFKIPFHMEENNRLVRNRNTDLIRERYRIKVELGHKVEWYIVMKITDVMGDKGDSKEVECLYLPQELNDKLIRGYAEEALNASEVLTDILSLNRNWSVGYIDADFQLTRRAFEFPDNTLLDAIYSVAETYNAIIEWHTDTRTFDLVKPELHGINRLGTFSYQRYLKSIDQESNAEVVATRLSAAGNDGLGIQRLNPTGQNYIEDYGYWIYPFERDDQRNVIRSSYYMSDGLCHALLDYKALIEGKEKIFGGLVSRTNALNKSLAVKKDELVELKTELAAINELRLTQQFNGLMFYEVFQFTGVTRQFTYPTKLNNKYAVLVRVNDAVGKTLVVNGIVCNIGNNGWSLSRKIDAGNSPSPITISLSGTGNTEVFVQIVSISNMEFAKDNNEDEIIGRYSDYRKRDEIAAKEAEIASVKAELASVHEEIDEITSVLSTSNHFTPDQLEELDAYILVHHFSDDKYIEESDLYEAAKEKFKEIQTPQLSVGIDIVNFMSCLEEQRSWHQLYLGDKIVIKYERFDLKVEAKIIEMDFDYANNKIKLTIAHFKDLTTRREQLEKFIYDSKNTTSIVDLNKSKWGQAVVDTSEFGQLFEHFWDKVTNQINMTVNQTVQIGENGITITDDNDPLRFLRLTNGQIGLTRSGGLRYETALTADGLIAEMVLGKLILGQRVTIGDPDGIWMTEGPRTTITDRCGRMAMKLGLYETSPHDLYGMIINRYDSDTLCSPTVMNRIIVNSEDGFKIQRKKISTFDDVFYTSLDGDLYMKGNFQAGEDEQIFKVTHTGLQLGGSDWATAPFHADMYGNVWMNKLFADSADIKNSIFKDGHIEGSTITLRNGGGVMKLDPMLGLWAGSEDFASSPASIGMDGTATFRKLIVKDKDNKLLIDGENRYIDVGGFDLVGAGAIYAELISAKMVTADSGFISDLTAGRLSTLTNEAKNGWFDYLTIEGNSMKWITGQVDGEGTDKDLPDGRALYWKDSSQQGQMTTEKTPWRVKGFDLKKKVKLLIDFKEHGDDAYPRSAWGLGDGMVKDDSVKDNIDNHKSARGFIEKPAGSFDFIYYAKNNAKERSLRLKDNGVYLNSQDDSFNVNAKNYKFDVTSGGDLKITHANGCEIEFASDGSLKLKSSVGMNFNAPSYHFA